MSLPPQIEFWDFGTKEKYYNGHFNVLKNKESRLFEFLVEHKSISEEKLHSGGGYGDSCKDISLGSFKLFKVVIKFFESFGLILASDENQTRNEFQLVRDSACTVGIIGRCEWINLVCNRHYFR